MMPQTEHTKLLKNIKQSLNTTNIHAKIENNIKKTLKRKQTKVPQQNIQRDQTKMSSKHNIVTGFLNCEKWVIFDNLSCTSTSCRVLEMP